MPTSVRAITTRLAVDGEREFKKAMSEVNTTMRTLKSELELVDAQFKGQANTMEALRAGVTVVDSAAGGLGGCPYAKSATGNLATEDLVWALDGLGVENGVDLKKLVAASVWMSGRLGRPSPSRVVTALADSV